uniref:Adenylate kinase isoenzyme 6 homolog n=1 Tax=Arcella intermedia TaxID=1963864 RepID=A0A6B2LM34_9EUKA
MPNILITGTPGVGKSSLSALLAQALPSLNYIDLGQTIRQKHLHDGLDEEWDSLTLNEDKVCDYLEDIITTRNNVIDYHTCDFFPERFFDLVIVVRCSNDVLYPRLEARGYSEKKIQENVEAEIMQVVLDEARDSYREDIVWEVQSNTIEEMEESVNRIADWVKKFEG